MCLLFENGQLGSDSQQSHADHFLFGVLVGAVNDWGRGCGRLLNRWGSCWRGQVIWL